MKKGLFLLSLCFFLCHHTHLFAQDWRFFPTGKTMYFLQESRNYLLSEQISDITTDSVRQEGDTLFHYINHKIKTLTPDSCLLREVVINDGVTTFDYNLPIKYHSDTIYWGRSANAFFLPHASVGTEWKSSFSFYGLEEKNTFKCINSVRENGDSIKTFLINNDVILRLSKKNGLLQYGTTKLIGEKFADSSKSWGDRPRGEILNPLPQVGDINVWDYNYWQESADIMDSVTAVKLNDDTLTVSYARIKTNRYTKLNQYDYYSETEYPYSALQKLLSGTYGNIQKTEKYRIRNNIRRAFFTKDKLYNPLINEPVISVLLTYDYKAFDTDPCEYRSTVASCLLFERYAENIGLVAYGCEQDDLSGVYTLTGARRGKKIYGTVKPFKFNAINEELMSPQVFIAPNPVAEQLAVHGIDWSVPSNYRFSISDVFGKTIIHNQPLTAPSIAVHTLTQGIYILQISDSTNQLNVRFIKE